MIMTFFYKAKPFILISYLLLIGISLGTIIATALSASSIFGAAKIVEDLQITHFQSGILMTSIFLKFNILMNILAFFIIVVEILYFQINKARITPFLGLVNIVLIFLFTLYYTPVILEAQKLGEAATQTEYFYQIHQQSVWVFKALIITLTALFFTHLYPKLKIS